MSTTHKIALVLDSELIAELTPLLQPGEGVGTVVETLLRREIDSREAELTWEQMGAVLGGIP